jgi:hypothetical protein
LPFPSPYIEQLSVDVARFNSDARGRLDGYAWADLQSLIKGVADLLHASRARTAVALSVKQRMLQRASRSTRGPESKKYNMAPSAY